MLVLIKILSCSSYVVYTMKDDLLASVMFGKFASGKSIGKFYIGKFVPHAIGHAQIETKWRILYWRFLHRTLFANINSLPINISSCMVRVLKFLLQCSIRIGKRRNSKINSIYGRSIYLGTVSLGK